jgi:hypothetical protein
MSQELSGCTALLWLFGQATVQEFTEVLTAGGNKTILAFSIVIFAKIMQQMCENIFQTLVNSVTWWLIPLIFTLLYFEKRKRYPNCLFNE